VGNKRERRTFDKENESLVFEIEPVHGKSRRIYGSPRITARLRASGIRCGKNCVARPMRENGIMAKTRRRFKITTDSKHTLPIARNLLKQEFTADAPNKTWEGDITYIWTKQGWMYLAVVLDLFNREIAGWSMRKRITEDDRLVKKGQNLLFTSSSYWGYVSPVDFGRLFMAA